MIPRSAAVLTALFIALPSVSWADVQITEIMYDADGSDSKREWIEIYNDADSPADISKLKFTDKSAHALNAPPKNGGTGSLTIPARGYAVIASDAKTFTEGNPSVAIVIDSVMSLTNAGASIALGDAVATYSKSMGAAGTGESLQLSGSAWIHAKPTPGAVNAKASTAKAAPTVKDAPKRAEKTKPAVKPQIAAAAAESSSENKTDGSGPATEDATRVPVSGGIGWQWMFAVAALALSTAAVAAIITREKRNEWEIVDESE